MSKRLIWHKNEIQEVIELLLSCNKKEEIELMFDRILTPREINDIARRYKALKMIEEGCSYGDIMIKTGMSSVTISRLSMKCGYGFRKSSGIVRRRQNYKLKNDPGKRTLKYKGISLGKIKK